MPPKMDEDERKASAVKTPAVKTTRSVVITAALMLEAINHTYPDLKVPPNAKFSPDVNGSRLDGVVLEWIESAKPA